MRFHSFARAFSLAAFMSVTAFIAMAFGVACVNTNKGKAMSADRLRTSPGTYTTSPKYIGAGTGATGAARTAVAADTALTTEVDSRVAGTESTVTTSQTGDTYQTAGTWTPSTSRAIDEMGTFDASSSGNMCISATLNVINVTSADTIAWTVKLQYT